MTHYGIYPLKYPHDDEQLFRGSLVDSGAKTKNQIALACSKLLQSVSYDDMRISDMLKASGVTKQTFYNHFADKRAVFTWIYKTLLASTLRRVGFDLDWGEANYLKLRIMKNNVDLFSAFLKSNDYEYYLLLEQDLVLQAYLDSIERITGQSVPPADITLVRIHCIGTVRLVSEWIQNGCVESVEEVQEINRRSMPSVAQKAFFGI